MTHEEITLQYSRYIYQARHCEDSEGNVASPVDDQFRATSGDTAAPGLYNVRSADTGYPLRLQCVQPAPSPPGATGFGQHSNSQEPGRRGAPTLSPDENVITLMASMWW